MITIELLDTGRRYNRQWIFRHIDLELSSPSSVAILGPNGSGKSTLLQVLAGFLSPSEGNMRLMIDGREIDIASVYQYVSLSAPYLELLEEFSLQEQLSFNMGLKGSFGGHSLEYLLERSGLAATGSKPIRQFSSGMKQRVKLLLACSSDTPLLLLDEPLTNLDQQGLLWYQQLIRDFSTDRCIIVASNNLSEYEFCTRQILIQAYK